MLLSKAIKTKTQKRGTTYIEVASADDYSAENKRHDDRCGACQRHVSHTKNRHDQAIREGEVDVIALTHQRPDLRSGFRKADAFVENEEL